MRAASLFSQCLHRVDFALPALLRRRIARRKLRENIRKRQRLVPTDGLRETYEQALRVLIERKRGRPLGDYLEFGVFNGTSLACMHAVTKKLGRTDIRLFGFDSFEGLPADCVDDKSPWNAGEFASGEEFTRAVLTEEGVDWKRVFLIRGRFSDSLKPALNHRFYLKRCSIIMVDCDLYLSAQQALQFCGPLTTDATVYIFDDWPADDAGYQGENVAFAEFLAANPQLSATKLDLSYAPTSAVFLVEPKAA
jgi:hypothetical protein